MRRIRFAILLTIPFAYVNPIRGGEQTVEEAVAALEKLGATINTNPANRAVRPVRSVLFPAKGCDVTDADLAHLAALKDLTDVFVINQKRVTGDGLKHLSGLKTLTTIDLMNTPVESKHLVHLKDLKQLHKLGLWRTAVDDEGLPHLKGLVNLEHLYLDKTAVGDKGIETFGPHASLCNVSWAGSRVTERGETLMKKNWPRLGMPPLRGD